MTLTGYVSVMPTSIQPDPLEVIKAWWYYFISTVLTPIQKKWLVLESIFATVLVINLPEVISTSHDPFDRPVWHHQIWNGAIWLELRKFLQRQTFSIQFHQTLFWGSGAVRLDFQQHWLLVPGPRGSIWSTQWLNKRFQRFCFFSTA